MLIDTSILRLHGKGISVAVDEIPSCDSVIRGRHWLLGFHENIHLPHRSTWTLGGPGFPNFTHTMATQNPVRILSPDQRDDIDATHPFELIYSAPSSDRIMLHVAFQGVGLMRKDSANQTPYDTGQSSYTPIATTGRYTIPALHLDSSRWRFFTPRSVLVDITSTKSDTMHVEDKIIGFVNEVRIPRSYRIVP